MKRSFPILETNLKPLWTQALYTIALERKRWNNFWTIHPALLCGLSALFGALASVAVVSSVWTAVWLLFLSTLTTDSKRVLYSLGISTAVFFFVQTHYKTPEISSASEGKGMITIEKIEKTTLHGKTWTTISGTIKKFHFFSPSIAPIKNGSFSAKIAARQIPTPYKTWHVQGKLRSVFPGRYQLQSNPKNWEQGQTYASLALIRKKTAEWLKSHLTYYIKNRQTRLFILSLATGKKERSIVNKDLERFGLSHILAVSGLHFAVVAAFFHLLVSLIFTPKFTGPIAAILLSSYYLVLGASPSIQRAWIFSLILLGQTIVKRTSIPLNSLGAALFIVVINSPLSILSAGFQLSFTLTASILLLYPLFLEKKLPLFPCFQRPLALSLSIFLVAFPLTLAFFHRYSLMSIFLNLLIPTMAGISLTLVIIGCACSFFPTIAYCVHCLNEHWTSLYLYNIGAIPMEMDWAIRCRLFPEPFLVLFITALFFFSARLLCKKSFS